jgi:hypothetical protein
MVVCGGPELAKELLPSGEGARAHGAREAMSGYDTRLDMMRYGARMARIC